MTSRRARDGEPRPPWWLGASRYAAEAIVDGHPLLVTAWCRLGGIAGELQALLDTGAQWSVIGGDLAIALEHEAEDEAHPVVLRTRLGAIEGRVYRVDITLVAEEGEDLLVHASVLLAPSWPAPPVLGYGGFLERIRIGLDPGSAPRDEPWLFFGSDR